MAGAGLYAMSAHRRPLVTAAASGAVLFALWFVPSAKAAPEGAAPPPAGSVSTSSSASPGATHPGGTGDGNQPRATAEPRLAASGGLDSLSYVAGGLGFLGLGGALVMRSARRPSLRSTASE